MPTGPRRPHFLPVKLTVHVIVASHFLEAFRIDVVLVGLDVDAELGRSGQREPMK